MNYLVYLWNRVLTSLYFRMLRRRYPQFAPLGHFYSPQPNVDEIKKNEEAIFEFQENLPGIDLNKESQEKIFSKIKKYYRDIPFSEKKNNVHRYFFDNDPYGYTDGGILYCMIRLFSPKKIIEVGSGYSSAIFLDSNELFFNNSIECVFIEPYPKCLNSLLREQDFQRAQIITKKVQEVDISIFQELSQNDILFIDSSHVSKIGSDVNHLYFKVLPALQKGVIIHIHDIHYPFEYTKKLVYNGVARNEAYLLRAFLQYNEAFEILFYTSYMQKINEDSFKKELPLLCKRNGSSIWLRKKL